MSTPPPPEQVDAAGRRISGSAHQAAADSGCVYVEGVGLWTCRLPGWQAARHILRGEAPPPAQPLARPEPVMLAPTARRRCPDSVAVALTVARAACAHAQRDPRSLPSVFASTHGDLATTDYMCETLARAPAQISPTRFHNSVHNAAAGYWTIATSCMEPYTALSAYEHTFAVGFITAATQALADATAVLLVAYDVQARGSLATVAPSQGIVGAALVLSPERTARSLARLALRFGSGAPAAAGATPAATAARPANAAIVAGNAMAACLPLFEALADERPRSLHLDPGWGGTLKLSLAPLTSTLERAATLA